MLSRAIIGGVLLCCFLAGFETAAESVRQGRSFKAKGDAASALHAFEQALSLDPQSAEIEDEVGFLLAAMNRASDAMPHFVRAIEIDPSFASAHFHLGVAYWMGGDANTRVPEVETAVRRRPR